MIVLQCIEVHNHSIMRTVFTTHTFHLVGPTTYISQVCIFQVYSDLHFFISEHFVFV